MASETFVDARRGAVRRPARAPGRPRISLVVASSDPDERLASYLEALLPRCRVLGVEVVVACPGDTSDYPDLVAAFPGVRFIAAPAGSTIAALKAAGMAAAGGDVVGLTDDAESVGADWLHALVEAWFNRGRSP